MDSFPWIDCYAHFRSFSAEQSHALPSALANYALDRLYGALGAPRIDRWYNRYQDVVNYRDNRFMSSEPSKVSRALTHLAMATNFPFYAGKTEDHLLENMDRNGISHALVVNLEPFQPHSSLLGACRGNPRLFPIVNLAEHLAEIEVVGESVVRDGAKAFAIHPILERRRADDPLYFRLAEFCRAHRLPLVCRTGATDYPGEFDRDAAEIARYRPLVEAFPDVTFVMTHSNLGRYEDAIIFSREFPNTILDSAWQTAASTKRLLEAVGPERFLFASDWPVLGDQQKVQKRIFGKLRLPVADLETIAFRNPNRIFGLGL